ncbi:MAG: bifunctional 2-polyprenyl-6-hydroxyphenol methylase/3-demethylubiquinol 3-O-methyltransferase UbiG [Proteobacteria bacterium]|nr:bifunctional 2-polyprenyl-6-hydroxyphenol methylase/3-demethylubiquinol 3-O-methyltransferase UbiG [Pseudomonadota bacterium]
MNATPEHAANGTNVDPAEIEKFDALASRFWDPQGEFGPLHKLNPIRLGYVADAAALSGAQVLDVGCGGGLLAEAMAGRGAHVTGIDLSPSLLSVAELHALESGVSVAYRRISAEQLAVERPAAFDVVTCMEMLEHVPDPAIVIGALARLVRPGGTIVVSTHAEGVPVRHRRGGVRAAGTAARHARIRQVHPAERAGPRRARPRPAGGRRDGPGDGSVDARVPA